MERSANGSSHSLVGQSPQICEIRRLNRETRKNARACPAARRERNRERGGRALHPRRQALLDEFVPIDCGSLVETLMESELFGHVKWLFQRCGGGG